MKAETAQRLLFKVMGWDENAIVQERADVQLLASIKYDHYQQFSAGMRFMESLALWLNSFSPQDRITLYSEIFKKRLIFISQQEMTHFVQLAYAEFINPFLISKSATKLSVNKYFTNKIINNDAYKKSLITTLYVGLSDGAKIDVFRRYNSHISNEQVLVSYDVSKSKLTEIKEELGNALVKRGFETNNANFETLVFLDDFSASGTSYARFDTDASKYTGKIIKAIKYLLGDEPEKDSFDVIIILYVATESAINHIQSVCDSWAKQWDRVKIPSITVHAVQTIPEAVSVEYINNEELSSVLKNNFDDAIVDAHWKKAKHANPHYGFGECGLPLVIFHNSPNNSLPIIWHSCAQHKPLFPRITRHKES